MLSDASKNSDGDVQGKINVAAAMRMGLSPAPRTSSSSRSITSPPSASQLVAGPRYIAIYLLALPVIVVAFASSGTDQMVSGLIALTWLVLAPVALYVRRAAMLLPITSALFLGLAIMMLSFDSAAFVVDVTATAIMFLVSVPRQWSQSVAASSASTARI
jgi:hypothetical protein